MFSKEIMIIRYSDNTILSVKIYCDDRPSKHGKKIHGSVYNYNEM